MSLAESGGVSQQSGRLKNNRDPQLEPASSHRMLHRGGSALLSLWGMLSATHTDPHNAALRTPSFHSLLSLYSHQQWAQPLIFPSTHLSLTPFCMKAVADVALAPA